MGILKSLFTLGKSFLAQAEDAIDEAQGVRMLEQHIRDAKAELDKAGKSRVDLLARVKLSHDKLNDLRERKASLETRALAAMSKNVDAALLNEVAEEIARLENAILAEEQVLTNLEASRDAAESLKRLQTRQAERQARLDAAAQLEKVADGRDLDEKLAQAGIGATNKSNAQDVLARLQRQQGE
ncbi:TPA: PspA/IM30 family protein [Salmonella enterica subsp. enterica serovar Mgulani]